MSSNELLNKESSKVDSKGYFQDKEKKNPTGSTEQYKERRHSRELTVLTGAKPPRVLKREKRIRESSSSEVS